MSRMVLVAISSGLGRSGLEDPGVAVASAACRQAEREQLHRQDKGGALVPGSAPR